MNEILLSWVALAALGFTAARAAEPVSIESLLDEMVDRDSVARFPEQDFRLKQHSSYNRASKTPDEPNGMVQQQGLQQWQGRDPGTSSGSRRTTDRRNGC